jgi:hypothetical protein
MSKRTFLGTTVAVPDGICLALKELIGEQASETIDRIRVLEHSTFARLHGRVRATTRRRRIFLRGSGAEFFADAELVLHEYCHVLLQWESGALTVSRYIRECLRHGYWNNHYEAEARAFAHHQLSQFRTLLAARGAGYRPGEALKQSGHSNRIGHDGQPAGTGNEVGFPQSASGSGFNDLAARDRRLPDVAPHDLGNPDRCENCAEQHPSSLADHEAHAESQIQTLQDPDRTGRDHQQADEAADDAHHRVERAHGVPPGGCLDPAAQSMSHTIGPR